MSWTDTTRNAEGGVHGWRRFLPPLSRPQWSVYIWLAYCIFFFFEPIFRHNLRYWLQNLAIFALFLFLYFCLDVIEVVAVKLSILASFVVLGIATISFNAGASTFFLYAACLLPFMLRSIPIVLTLVALDFFLLVGESVLLKHQFLEYAIAAFFLLVGGVSNTWMARQKWLTQKLIMAQEEITELAAVAERERIARDLHDVLGHTLSVIVLKAELAGRLMQRDPARAAREIADVESTARTALAEVREAIGGYHSKGLVAELAFARRTLEAAGVALTCEAPPNAESNLHATEETVLSLAVREAVTNIVRHANATRCLMRFERASNGFHALMIEDDGTHAVKHEGNGLRGMRARVEALGGHFSIRSDCGTRLLIELPVLSPGSSAHTLPSPSATPALTSVPITREA
jgi:two-component system sensor histidine kinase DesK